MSETQAGSQALNEARAWLDDCTWMDVDDSSELTDAQVRRGVQRHYEGGWAGFLADGA